MPLVQWRIVLPKRTSKDNGKFCIAIRIKSIKSEWISRFSWISRADLEIRLTFKFKGWHPQCMCYAVPILMDEEIFDDNELGDLKAALRGTTYQHKQAANVVPDVPQGFKDWVKDHIEAQKKWASTPYFIRDNFVDGLLDKGLKIPITVVTEVNSINVKGKAECAVEELIAKSIGAPIAEPMTHEQANAMRCNPHYAVGEQYRVNCQSCVVTYEMRRRGIDAETVPNFKKEDSVTYFLSRNTDKAWRNAKRILPDPNQTKKVNRFGRIRSIRYSAMDIWNNDILPQLEVVGRYHISWVWKGRRNGHIITMEKLGNGKVRLYDPQNGKSYSTPKEIWYKGEECRIKTEGLCFYRVDNLAPDESLVERILLKKDSKPISGRTSRKSSTNGITSADKSDTPAPSIFSQRKQWLKEDNFQPQDKERFDNMRGTLKRTGLSRKNVINHLYSKEELEAAQYIWKNPHTLKYKSSGKLGEVKDPTKEKDIKNIKKKEARNVVQYNLYEFEYNGKTWRIKTEENKDGSEAFYSLVK